ncbi:Uncharacterised protein [Chromobacterium violaceum]|uniref:Uncharacterized protein n=1 Tax=Chromobacterium violaceum TaxID=536 RepID=A0A3S4LNZ1_CHRVL|nr:Uncharacterised protein [Chromobacterium violaceum]
MAAKWRERMSLAPSIMFELLDSISIDWRNPARKLLCSSVKQSGASMA